MFRWGKNKVCILRLIKVLHGKYHLCFTIVYVYQTEPYRQERKAKKWLKNKEYFFQSLAFFADM